MDVRLKIDQETGKVIALMMWHPIGDRWVHIAQIFNGESDEIEYIVDGEKIPSLPNVPDEIAQAIEALKEKEMGSDVSSVADDMEEEDQLDGC